MSKSKSIYKKDEGVSEGGSLLASHTTQAGDNEIFTIRCFTCSKLLFRMDHKYGDGHVLHLDVESFKFKAYCTSCQNLRKDLEEKDAAVRLRLRTKLAQALREIQTLENQNV